MDSSALEFCYFSPWGPPGWRLVGGCPTPLAKAPAFVPERTFIAPDLLGLVTDGSTLSLIGQDTSQSSSTELLFLTSFAGIGH